MSAILDALPGNAMRVSEVIPSLAKYWQESAMGGSSTRAAQMNLVVVFGESVTPQDANDQIEHVLTLSRRYPCRVIALCPDTSAEARLAGKMNISCFPTPNGREQRCGEALFLGFPVGVATDVLSSQVSIWLESDLPVYFWLHGVTVAEATRYLPLVKSARRVVYDGSVSGDLSVVAWPKPEVVRDLARSRLLAVRQALGQFLSAYSPESLAEGLTRVSVRYARGRAGESRNLLAWMRAGLEEGSRRTGIPLVAEFTETLRDDCNACLSTEWEYSNGGSFRWDHAPKGNGAQIEADIGGRRYAHSLRVPFLDQPTTLAEAMFF